MFWRLKMKKTLTILFTLLALCGNVVADEPKTKFYDFEDLVINGEYKKPQVLYIDSDSQVRFERLLKLKKNLLMKLRETKTDNSLR
jgi:dephospho-CoA kinase